MDLKPYAQAQKANKPLGLDSLKAFDATDGSGPWLRSGSAKKLPEKASNHRSAVLVPMPTSASGGLWYHRWLLTEHFKARKEGTLNFCELIPITWLLSRKFGS